MFLGQTIHFLRLVYVNSHNLRTTDKISIRVAFQGIFIMTEKGNYIVSI